MAISTYLASVWSATEFGDPALAEYAENRMRTDTRAGVQALAGIALLAQLLVALLVVSHDLERMYIYSNLLFGLLSLHVFISAVFIDDVRTLQALGITFLVLGAMTVTLLAHRSGDLSIGVMAAVIILFVAIPLVPWALREAAIVISLTYLLLTLSLAAVPGRFEPMSLWILQFLVLGAAAITCVITARNTHIRKQDIHARYELESAHRSLEQLSMRDHLTGAWNRRFLDERFKSLARASLDNRERMHIAVLDVDNFKAINDRFGHLAGDKILCAIASTFIRYLEDCGHLVRLGGDEFQIIYNGDRLDELIEAAIADLQRDPAVRQLGNNYPVTLSAGITCSEPGSLPNLEAMYKAADKALYDAKACRPPVPDQSNLLTRTGTWIL